MLDRVGRLALLATLASVALRPSSAHACSGPCPRLSATLWGDGQAAPGGVTLLHCSDCTHVGPLEAVDAQGAVHAGEVSEVAHERPSWPLVPRTYFVWRPAAPLPAGGYRLRAVDSEDQGEELCSIAAFEVEIHVPGSVTAEALPDVMLTLGTAHRPAGTVFECTDRCDPARLGTRSQEAPYLEHRIEVGEDHPARATHLVRLVAVTDNDAVETGPWLSLGSVTGPTITEDGVFVAEDMQHGGVTFPSAQDEYCAGIELFDVVNDTRETIDAGCVQHDLPDGRLETVPAYGTCERFEHGTMERYTEAFCGDNAQDCAGGDWRCDDWRKHCTTQPDPADASTATPEDAGPSIPAQSVDAGAIAEGPDGGVEAPDGGAESDGGGAEPRPSRSGAGGCQLDTATGARAPWPLLLLAAWLVRRARRAR